MQEEQLQNQPEDEEETGLAGLVVPAPSIDAPNASPPAVAVDPLAADRAQRVAAIRAEAAAREAEAAKAGKPIVERPEPSASLLAAAEEHAAAEMRAASPFKVSSNANEVLPTREELIRRQQALDAAAQKLQPAGPVNVLTDPQYEGKTWEEVVAMRQEAHRQRRYQKELAEKESNQIAKEQFKERILAARRPETTVHRPQPIAPAISAQTLAEMEAGRKRSEEFKHSAHVPIMPRSQ
jgi:hypothetical protein